MHILMYIYIYIFAGPLALGVVRSRKTILYIGGLPPPIILPRCGWPWVVAWPWLSLAWIGLRPKIMRGRWALS